MEATTSRIGLDPAPTEGSLNSARLFLATLEDNKMITTISIERDVLRLLHRVVAEAHDNWPGGDANEQACLLNMKTQLYAALMDHLLESGSI